MYKPIQFMEGQEKLNSQDYLMAICNYGYANNLLQESGLVAIQKQLWSLLTRQTERYTMGDSSSVKVEVAQELLKSICYCLGFYLRKNFSLDKGLEKLQTQSLEQIFAKAQEQIQKEVILGKSLLLQAKKSRIIIDNFVYQDMFKVMDDFYIRYDSCFNAHGLPAMLDYPIYWQVEDLQGVEYSNEYLHRLNIEHNFCQKFSSKKISCLLQVYCKGDNDLIINLFEPIFINALALVLLNKNALDLKVDEKDKRALFALVQNHSKPDLQEKMLQAVEKLCLQIKIEDFSAKEYLKNIINDLVIRVKGLDSIEALDNVFISFTETKKDVVNKTFLTNTGLSDEALRKLIEELGSCRYQEDKLLMVKEHVHNVEDFVEVLEASFYDNEYDAVFELLSEAELKILSEYIFARYGQSETFFAEKPSWLVRFLEYTKDSK